MYFDLLLLLNLLVNYLLLLLTARLLRRRPGFWRLAAGGAVGAAAVGVLLLPGLPWLIPAAVFFSPAAMVAAAFWPLRRVELPLLWGAFFLVSFTAGGVVVAVSQLLELQREGLAGWRGVGVLVLACLFLYLCVGLIRPYVEERRWQSSLKAVVRVSWGGKVAELPALVDTGNRLREPFGQRPVIVADFRSLEEVLPGEIYRSLADPAVQSWEALERLSDPSLARSFTLVPARGVGGGEEMLLGLRPDTVAIKFGRRAQVIDSGVILGLHRRGFGPVAEYSALLPPELAGAG